NCATRCCGNGPRKAQSTCRGSMASSRSCPRSATYRCRRRRASTESSKTKPFGRRPPMAKLDDLLEELVTANHVLAKLGIVDSFGHISVRHPDKPDRFFLSCSRAPERVKRDDIMEFNLECEPIDAKGRNPYTER